MIKDTLSIIEKSLTEFSNLDPDDRQIEVGNILNTLNTDAAHIEFSNTNGRMNVVNKIDALKSAVHMLFTCPNPTEEDIHRLLALVRNKSYEVEAAHRSLQSASR